MESKCAVTIIIPVLNRAAAVCRCLDSVAAQHGVEACELIVVDNGSTDGTASAVAAWAESHPSVALRVMAEPRRGVTLARNLGLEATATPYVMFFDSDDIMLPGHLRRLLDGIRVRPDAELFGWDELCTLPGGRLRRAVFSAGRHALRRHLIATTVSTQRIAVRTSLLRRVGAWHPSLRGWNDFELGVRLLLASPVTVKLGTDGDAPTVVTLFSEDSITGRRFSDDPAKWEEALDAVEASLAAAGRPMDALLSMRRAVLAGHYAREGAVAEARRLRSAIGAKGVAAIRMWLYYAVTRLFGRGAARLALLLES